MNSAQRVKAAFGHQTPDRTPIFEYVLLAPIAERVLGRPHVDYDGQWDEWFVYAREAGSYDKALRRYAKNRVELAQRLGHDIIKCNMPPPQSMAPENSGGDGADAAPAPDDPVEAIRHSNARRQAALEKGDDYPTAVVYSYLREEMAARGLDIPLFAPAFGHGVWTDVDLMQTMLLEPEVAHRHFELCTREAERRLAVYFKAGIGIVGVGGDFAGNRPLISPRMYREYIMPQLKKLTDLAHRHGAVAVNASDGDLWGVIDDFLIGTGVDGYAEIDAGAGMDLGRLKEEYGDRITFLGNIDCGNLLSFASPQQVARAVVSCLEAGLGGGGHIFTASNAITASVPMENYLAMVNAYRDYFRLPRFALA